jgi:hypothetical protein
MASRGRSQCVRGRRTQQSCGVEGAAPPTGLLFDCKFHLPNAFAPDYHLAERTTLAAQALGPVAPEASRVLLSPFLNDLTWRIGRWDIGKITPLGVAAQIDPEWAAQIAEQLMDEEFRTDRLRQTLVLGSLLDGLAKP